MKYTLTITYRCPGLKKSVCDREVLGPFPTGLRGLTSYLDTQLLSWLRDTKPQGVLHAPYHLIP